MKAVLMSIKPKWCELIASGKKTVEVRKTKPKIDVPFKCYIYCTQNGKSLIKDDTSTTISFIAKNSGKVIGEFVCDRIDNYECELWNDEAYELIRQFDYDEDGDIVYKHGAENNENCEMLNNACLTWQDIRKYLGNGINSCYAWHISNLVIYDKPKELSEFYSLCEKGNCYLCDWEREYDSCGCNRKKPITRPPQSYMFVEELGV